MVFPHVGGFRNYQTVTYNRDHGEWRVTRGYRGPSGGESVTFDQWGNFEGYSRTTADGYNNRGICPMDPLMMGLYGPNCFGNRFSNGFNRFRLSHFGNRLGLGPMPMPGIQPGPATLGAIGNSFMPEIEYKRGFGFRRGGFPGWHRSGGGYEHFKFSGRGGVMGTVGDIATGIHLANEAILPLANIFGALGSAFSPARA